MGIWDIYAMNIYEYYELMVHLCTVYPILPISSRQVAELGPFEAEEFNKPVPWPQEFNLSRPITTAEL